MAESVQHKLDRVRRPRVQITYDVETGGAMRMVELPFVVGVLADLSGQPKQALRPLYIIWWCCMWITAALELGPGRWVQAMLSGHVQKSGATLAMSALLVLFSIVLLAALRIGLIWQRSSSTTSPSLFGLSSSS